MPDPRRVDEPRPGYFMIRLVRGGPPVAAAICHDAKGWYVIIDGVEKRPAPEPWDAEDMSRVWHYGREVPEEEYRFRVATAEHARVHDPSHPAAKPDQAVDFLNSKPVF